jgi:hypothetical protein
MEGDVLRLEGCDLSTEPDPGGLSMGTSAFEVLIVPVFLATLGSCMAGAILLSLMNAVETLAGSIVRTARSLKAARLAARDLRRGVHRPIVRGVGSIGSGS